MNILSWIFRWLVVSIVVFAAAYVLPGVTVSGFTAALIVAIVLGLINLLIKPLILLFTLPINILTLGLFTLVINAFLILLAAAIVPGFEVSGFWSALLFSVILSVVNSILFKDDD